ncbi:hypothetical protein [Arcobacter sp.]|uniref:hypothetical protein n=1 Tax=Arcobacter sp. TaxID=1872629 RepID=UPI003D12FF58
MTKFERASQLWPILALAATNRQVLTYDLVYRLTGIPRPAIGKFLEPIQSYCMAKEIPALTSIVVSEKTGLPGEGFIAANDVPFAHIKVFNFDWLDWGCPDIEKLEATNN